MKIVLAGTPKFSVPIFENIIKNFDVVAIISQPNRPGKRGMKEQETPTSILAKKYNIPLFQPEKISIIKQELIDLDYDFLVTTAFGQWVPDSILNIAKKASVNVHGSLLPKYRGAAPIQHSILNNENTIGITLIYMVKEMDAGDMIAKASLPIDQNITSKDAFKLLSELAADNIVKWLNDLYNDKITPEKQNENQVTLAPKIEKSFAELFIEISTQDAIQKIRALNDNPGAFIIINNKRLKIFRASLEPIKNALQVQFHDGIIYCYEYQWEGKKRVFI